LKAAFVQQEKRFKEIEAGKRAPTIFDDWCAHNTLWELEKAFLVQPLPHNYFDLLSEFTTRVLLPHQACLDSVLLLCVALMHPSWIHSGNISVRRFSSTNAARAKRDGLSPAIFEGSPILSEGNARLELLGDSVLKMAITEQVVRQSGLGKGQKLKEIATARSMLENNELLGLVALKEWRLSPIFLATHVEFLYMRNLDLGEADALPQWSHHSDELLLSGDNRAKSQVQYGANCVEALLGALAIDRGPGVAARFIQDALVPQLKETAQSSLYTRWRGESWDPISDLQHVSLARWKQKPQYRTLSQLESSGQFTFHIGVYQDTGAEEGERLLALAKGSSLAIARRNAATAALELLRS